MLDDGNIDSRTDYENIDDAFSSLSDVDMLRLRRAANKYSLPSRYTPDELLAQMFCKVLDGSRKYKKGIHILAFLIKTMQSLASSDCKSQMRKPECKLDLDEPGKQDASIDSSGNVGQSPEDLLVSKDSTAHIKETILKLFDDKPDVKDVVEAIMEDMSRAEIQELMDLDDKGYNTKRRYIRRRLQKTFPEGWKDE